MSKEKDIEILSKKLVNAQRVIDGLQENCSDIRRECVSLSKENRALKLEKLRAYQELVALLNEKISNLKNDLRCFDPRVHINE